jgi:AcrR family transcriptional regulator
LQTRSDDYRTRLLKGMQEAIATVGWAELTIADIVKRARVSRRTFYEHFGSKEDCLLALYEAGSEQVLSAIEAAIAPLPPGEPRIVAGTAAYLASLQSDAGSIRTRFIEILHLGEPGLQVRRQVLRRFAELLMREMGAAGVRLELTPALATAIVGGINELVLEALEEDRAERLDELFPSVTALIRAFLAPAAEPREVSPAG